MVVAFYFRLHLAYFPRPVVAIFARPEQEYLFSWIALPIPTDLFTVVFRPANRGKAAFPRHHHIVRSAGAVDDEQFTVCVPAANDANMGIIRIEH